MVIPWCALVTEATVRLATESDDIIGGNGALCGLWSPVLGICSRSIKSRRSIMPALDIVTDI